MREPAYSGQFRKDVRLAEKRGKDLLKLRQVMELLIERSPIARHFMDHALRGEWKHFRDLHVEPDWLLIYRIDGAVVRFERTGTHAIFSIESFSSNVSACACRGKCGALTRPASFGTPPPVRA